MINETLKNRLPALPEGYRWRYEDGHGVAQEVHVLYLDKKTRYLRTWEPIAQLVFLEDVEPRNKYSIDSAARTMYNQFINKKEEIRNPLVGVTDK